MKTKLLKSVYIGFIFGLFSLIFVNYYMYLDQTVLYKSYLGTFITNLITYILLSYCYFHFITLVETSRRIRILRELNGSKNGLALNEILDRYNAGEIIKVRLNRLLNNRQLKYKDDSYFIGNSFMLLTAKAITIIKKIILGRARENTVINY